MNFRERPYATGPLHRRALENLKTGNVSNKHLPSGVKITFSDSLKQYKRGCDMYKLLYSSNPASSMCNEGTGTIVQRPIFRFGNASRDHCDQEMENGRQLTSKTIVTHEEDDEDHCFACSGPRDDTLHCNERTNRSQKKVKNSGCKCVR